MPASERKSSWRKAMNFHLNKKFISGRVGRKSEGNSENWKRIIQSRDAITLSIPHPKKMRYDSIEYLL